MSQLVRVRLVPKSREGISLATPLSSVAPSMAKRFAPDHNLAESALQPALDLGIVKARITRHNAVEGDVPYDSFEAVFKTSLVEKPITTSEKAVYSRAGTMLTASNEIVVPDELTDAIAFAYIPTPPIFLDIAPIPPCVSVYHLRLMEVLRILNGSKCHRHGWTGRNVRVAMTDSGFAKHPYFDSQGYNIERVSTPSAPHPMVDASGHGTGESANVLVVAPDCHFIGVKHNDYSAEAIETALEQKPRIITNSWCWNVDWQSKAELKASDPNFFNELQDIENIISDAIDDGVIVIFAAGNEHLAFPASIPDVLAVGGVTVRPDGKLEASNYASSFISKLYPGRQVPDLCGIVGERSTSISMKGHIMLPVPNGSDLEGKNMPASQSRKGWGIFSGTSAAAPQVAGIAALLLSINPDLGHQQIKSILAATATDIVQGITANEDRASIGFDRATGAGLADAFQACSHVAQMIP